MAKILVTYFSASSGRITERYAKVLAKELNADLFEIAPVSPYTEGGYQLGKSPFQMQ